MKKISYFLLIGLIVIPQINFAQNSPIPQKSLAISWENFSSLEKVLVQPQSAFSQLEAIKEKLQRLRERLERFFKEDLVKIIKKFFRLIKIFSLWFYSWFQKEIWWRLKDWWSRL